MKEETRASMGTLRVLGMEILETDADPTTAYLQTYHPGRCSASCLFCAQSQKSCSKNENIARGLYVPRKTDELLSRLPKAYKAGLLKRACIQTMNYADMLSDLFHLVGAIRKVSEIPISVSTYPLQKDRFIELSETGVDRLVVPLDAASRTLFEAIKGKDAGGPYRWESHLLALQHAVKVFGAGRVGTHIIAGLGETEEEMLSTIAGLRDMGVYTSLFAYTYVPGAALTKEQPDISSYRRIQLASYLLEKELLEFEDLSFDDGILTDFGCEKSVLEKSIEEGTAFTTRGCPDCNRPYSNEKPGGVMYNYPYKPSKAEIEKIRKEVSPWR